MKRLLLVFLFMLGTTTVYAQQFEDYIEETRGDTVVVRDYISMGNVPNSLIDAIELDSNPPEGRVYELKRGGVYWLTSQYQTPEDRPLRIVGAAAPPMVIADDAAGPPIISGTTDEGTPTNGDIIQYRNDLLLKNLIALPAATDASQGWTFLVANTPGNLVTLENVLMEHTNWVFVQSNDNANSSVHIRDSYFVNMSGQPCRRNGGVYDNVSNPTNEIVVENSTHVMAQGMMYKFRNFPINRAFFNHNTFVNISGQLFTTFGYQIDWTVTNNLFINSNTQAYTSALDLGETDQDLQPMGIINVDTLTAADHFPDPNARQGNSVALSHMPVEYRDVTDDLGTEAGRAEWENMRKILVDRNGVYWDPRLDAIVEEQISRQVFGTTDWATQMITMNERTQAMFDSDDEWPLLTEGSWIMGGDPGFVNDGGLTDGDAFDDFLFWNIEASSLGAAPGATTDPDPPTGAALLDKWRLVYSPADDFYTNPDWPIAVNLAYTNSEYLTGALGGLPLGDLNWFPPQKSLWEANRESLYNELESALNAGRVPEHETLVAVEDTGGEIPTAIHLEQNYPNPFNPTTQIRFSVPQQADVVLEIFDIAGRRVATLINEQLSTGNYTVTWDARNQAGQSVSSGVYMYRLRAGDVVETKQMMFIK